MINLDFLGEEPVAVFGLGKTGIATAAALHASAIPYLAWDDNPVAREKALKDGMVLTELNSNSLQNCQAIVWSPGIAHTLPQPHPVALIAKQLGVPLITDLDLLYRAQPDATYVGITGTNGKSTTTALIAHILQQAGRTMAVGGNLGYPALTLAHLGKGGVYVLELSSYQTELMHDLRCDIAVWLNLSTDHLERHGDTEGYAKAKGRIFQPRHDQSLAIVGSDDEFSRAQITELLRQNRQVVQLSSAVDDSKANQIDDAGTAQISTITYDTHHVYMAGHAYDLSSATALPGLHNAQNAAAAFAVCRALGLADATIMAGVNNYTSLPHRQQIVAKKHQVTFINDSKGTNPEATAKALACYDRIYWIIGGRPTSDGLNGLEGFVPRIQHAFIMGEASADFAVWCQAQNLLYTLCGTLDQAVPAAVKAALADPAASIVLLSPACKSWDQFTGYEARGELFAELVHKFTV